MDYFFLSNTPLFLGTSPQEAEQMLTCLASVTRAYQKGETIFRAGECIRTAGLVLRGSVTVESDDFWGNRSILSRAAPGDIFGEAYACLSEQPLLVSAVAAECCEVLFLDVARALHMCSNACAHHSRIVQNLRCVRKRICACRSGCCIPRPRPSVRGCYPTSTNCRSARAATIFRCRTTGRQWQII